MWYLDADHTYWGFKKYWSIFFIGYVQELKGELFSVTSKSQLKSVSDKYNAKVPPPLTSQFTERVNKPEAVKSYKEREKREVTHLYPSGKICWWNYRIVNTNTNSSHTCKEPFTFSGGGIFFFFFKKIWVLWKIIDKPVLYNNNFYYYSSAYYSNIHT